MHGQQNDKYTEMHGQQNDKYTEMQGQQNDKYTEMHGQQNDKYTEMHGQQNVTSCDIYAAKKCFYIACLKIYKFRPLYRPSSCCTLRYYNANYTI